MLAPSPALFELRGISKSFPGVKALDNVSFEVHEGEVHMLLGENGAGKSSLMKVLCGAYRADEGDFFFKGDKVIIGSAADAQRFGIAVIFQEFSLVPYLDIAHNIFLGREFSSRLPGLIDRRKIYREAKRVLDMIGFDVDPHTVVSSLGVAQQQMVEIAKALSQNARILVMDEPTAALSDKETEQLFSVMKRLQADGVAIVYISHRMAEVFSLGDRITVLRDGKRVGGARPGEVSPDDLVRMMVGRQVDMSYARTFATPGDIALELRGLSAPSGIEDINIVVRTGEIVGLCGLVGSGRTEVARAIFGADPISAGEIEVFGRKRKGGPLEAVRDGIALIPESRKTQGLALKRTVGENIVGAALSKLFPSSFYRPSRARVVADDIIAQLRIATPSANQTVGNLSGGNQQKLLLAKMMLLDPSIVIIDEPTRGIDIGTKEQIYRFIAGLADEGRSIIVVSSEMPELIGICDRILVMRSGRIVGEVTGERMTENDIVALATGVHTQEPA